MTENASFVRFVKDIQKDKPDDVIQIFDRKSFYAVYGKDAIFIANEYFKTLATVVYLGSEGNKLASQSIQPGQLENILMDILNEKQFKFEIWASKSSSQWERVKRGSPGNVVGLEELFSCFTELDSIDSCTIAVRLGTDKSANKVVGVAICNPATQTLRVAEFIETVHFTNFESTIIQANGVKECLTVFDKKNPDHKYIADVLQRCGVVLTEVTSKDFTSKDIEQDLTRLLGKLTNNLADLELKYATEALSCLIKYLELMADESNFGQYTMKRLDLSQYMHLDSAAIDSLKLVAAKRDVNKHLNLYSLLNKCCTTMGSRRLLAWVRQPLLDIAEIELRLNLNEVFVNDHLLRNTLRDIHFKRAPDFSRILKRLQRNQGRLEDCVQLYYFFENLPALYELFKAYSGPHDRLIRHRYTNTLEGLVDAFSKFTEMIRTTIDLNAAEERHEYIIRADFDETLQELAQKKVEIQEKIERHSDSVHSKLKHLKSFTIMHSSQFGHCFKVTRKDEKDLRTSSLKYFPVDTRKDGVKFKTVKLKQLGEEYETCCSEYESKQSELVSSLLQIVAGYEPALLEVSELVTELDVICGLSHVFANSVRSYVRPTIVPMGEGDIILKGARHPCLEIQDNVQYIANDVAFLRDSSSFHIITGPNMGGKSTFIRSVGVIVLMAQMGCFVPCDSAEVSIVDAILCRVGAGDSQSRGVSTFMAEMLETTSILETATPNSLIIIDELGRGTSTYDGFGLAWAISE